jgi:hypothetical protein
MHFYMHFYLHKNFILIKSGCYRSEGAYHKEAGEGDAPANGKASAGAAKVGTEAEPATVPGQIEPSPKRIRKEGCWELTGVPRAGGSR